MKILSLLSMVRGIITRTCIAKPFRDYIASNSVKPVSSKFGLDRGTPIDRYWIDLFLDKYASHIRGVVLEIGDNRYTTKYGDSKVIRSDILDVNTKNKAATIIGDLRNLQGVIKNNSYDCIILSHVLGIMDDPKKAIRECYRILKPNGILLITSSCISPTYGSDLGFWRFTPASIRYVLRSSFQDSFIKIHSYGNVMSAQMFYTGYAQEEVSKEVLDYQDSRFCCVVGAFAQKVI